MLADLEPEATPLRRLIAFAAVFLGMLTLANAAFARQPPLLSPPAVLGVVLLAGVAGLTIWINGRWARAFFWVTAGFAALVAAGTGASLVAPPWGIVSAVSVLLGAIGMAGGFLAGAGLVRSEAWLAQPARIGRIAVGGALVLLGAIWFPAGGGPIIAVTAALYALALVYLLRPVTGDGRDVSDDETPAEREPGRRSDDTEGSA